MSNKGKIWSRGIFIFYTVFIILLISAVIYSINNNVELVSKNYYEKTLSYENQIQAINNTSTLAVKPVIGVDKDKQQIFLLMPQEFSAQTIKGKINFFRPSEKRLDFSALLNCDSQNKQAFPMHKMASGKWKIQVTWEAGSKKYYFEQVIFI